MKSSQRFTGYLLLQMLLDAGAAYGAYVGGTMLGGWVGGRRGRLGRPRSGCGVSSCGLAPKRDPWIDVRHLPPPARSPPTRAHVAATQGALSSSMVYRRLCYKASRLFSLVTMLRVRSQLCWAWLLLLLLPAWRKCTGRWKRRRPTQPNPALPLRRCRCAACRCVL